MRIGRNAFWNIGEIVAASLALFLMFKIIVGALGLEALGVWSLVLATTSLARLADLGVTGGVGKFVTQTNARREQGGELASPLAYVETAVIANALLYAGLAVAAFWPAKQAILAVLDGSTAQQAVELLPYALLSFVLGGVSSTVGAGLLGLNRSDLKSQIMIAGYALQLLTTVILAPRFGLPGVAAGQIVQHLLVSSAAWLMTCRVLEGHWRIRLPIRLALPLLRPLLSYGVRLQGVTLASFLYEPVVKFLIAGVGGAAALGLFEMAFRLVTQSRQFLAAPCQNLLPLYVQATEVSRPVEPIYKPAAALVGVLAVFGLGILTLATPWISLIWLGRTDPTLTLFVAVLSAGWFVNIAAIPAFYLGLASGHLRWNIAGSAATTLSALVIGWPLGQAMGPLGIVIGSSLAVAVGAVMIVWGNSRMTGISPFPNADTFRFLTTAALTRLRLVR